MSCSSCFYFVGSAKPSGRVAKARLKGSLKLEKEKSQREIADFHSDLDFIGKVPLFKSLPFSDHPSLARAFATKTYSNGRVVVSQGDRGDVFFIIKSGQADVFVNDEHVSTLRESDYFGELALLRDAPQNAHIVAVGNLECLELSKDEFERFQFGTKLRFKRRETAVQSNGMFINKSEKSVEKNATVRNMLKEALRRNKDIGSFLAVNDDDLKGIIKEAFWVKVTSGTDIIKQGDIIADLFYILDNGTARAIKDGTKVAVYSKMGDSFGGSALLNQEPQAATVQATSECKLWCIPRAAMREVLRAQVASKVETYVKILDKVDIFDDLTAADKKSLADALVETTYYQDEFIITEGDEKGNSFYILDEGRLEVTRQGRHICYYESERTLMGARSETPAFGERALLFNEARAASVRVSTPKATLLVLARDIFLQVLKPRKSSDDPYFEAAEGFVQYDYSKLTTVGLLGRGGFGKVTLVHDGVTGQYFALKTLSKGHVLKEGHSAMVMNEKRILRMTHCPFLVQVAATFNLEDHLAFLLEPAAGGDLFTLYMKNKFHGKESMAKFYGACVLKGLEHLHERSIIYRDMKPENLLLDTKGYCKMADFGLAKFVIGKTFTTCGTPDYYAPELLKGSGHTIALDWWTLGILIFELMTGATPFSADDVAKMFSKMSRGIEHTPAFSRSPPKNWHDLVKGFCKLNPSERLPVRPGGVANVMDHDWYKSTSFFWPDLSERTMKAPWNPGVKVSELAHFDAHEDEAPHITPYRDPQTGWDADFEDLYGPPTFDEF